MIETTPESLAAMAATFLPPDPPPTEAQVDEFLARISAAFVASPEVLMQARNLIHARLQIRMELGDTLSSEVEHMLWLAARRVTIDPFYWSRYRQLLLRSGWPPLVTSTLDRATDDLLDFLGDPAEVAPWKRRGLVVGDVQSGKTATYSALICKAADAGYRMVILLTGVLENVRRQTQERLDAAFIGLDSSDFLVNTKFRQQTRVGVGDIDKRRFGIVFTSRDHDFRKNAASALNISLNAVTEPVLVVAKKNKAILERLAGWLRAKNPGRQGRIALPMLLIDDEADNASINTKQSLNETTAINKAIRQLLTLFERTSYVGFTATPFANIFIDPTSTDEMLDDDLFPRDFIHVLKPPDNYIGMDRLFAASEGEEPDGPSGSASENTIRPIDDATDWLPSGHRKDAEFGPLPESLLSSLRCFLLSCAARDLRARFGEPGGGGSIHRSMLVNVSRFTDVQNRVADALHLQLEDYRRAVRLYGRLPAEEAEARSPEIGALARTWSTEFGSVSHEWSSVLHSMLDAISPIRIQPVNQKTGSKSLDYGIAATPPGVRVIAVGGNSLSRGLTLEGLSTSYFLRDPRAYDTLLQMGRWFGYRDGYKDLCRLWVTEDAQGWYEHVTMATGDLKRDFARMRRRQASPREFGLRVRTHPDTLLITARNKMATGRDVVVQRDISLMGRPAESSRLYADKRRNVRNVETLNAFFAGLRTAGVEPGLSPHGGAVVWHGAPAAAIADLLEGFLTHPLKFDYQGDAIADFLRRRSTAGDGLLERWTVAVPTDGKDKRPVTEIPELGGWTIMPGWRKLKVSLEDGSAQVSGKSSKVGGRSDLRHGLTKEDYVALRSSRNEDDFRQRLAAPLLIVFLLRGFQQPNPDSQEVGYREGLLLPALGLHFPPGPMPDEPGQLIRYRLNTVAQRELLPAHEEDDDDVADEADDLD